MNQVTQSMWDRNCLIVLAVGLVCLLALQSASRAVASDLDGSSYENGPPPIRTSSATFGQILVKFRAKASPAERMAILQRYQLQPGRSSSDLDLAAAQLLDTNEAMAFLSFLSAESAVEYAEPDYIYHALGPNPVLYAQPNDRFFSEQWALRQIHAPAAWETSTGSANVVIAVVDTGVDLTHPDLVGKLVNGASFVSGSPNEEDDSGHGTHIASTAASASNNRIGVAGVGWATRIMPVKVLAANGSGRVSDIADGIRWAVDHGADIVNLSLGGNIGTRTLQAAIDYADRNGVLVVAAVGNDFDGENAVNYPAAYDNVLAVAASDQSDQHADFSSSGEYVDIAAPGVGIFAATWRGRGYSYATYDGTSMATSIVSAVAALLLAIDSNLTTDQVTTILQETATDLEAIGWDSLTGHGRVDAAAAVAFVANRTESEPTAPATGTKSFSFYLPALWR